MILEPRQRLFFVLAATFCTCLTVGDIIGGKLIEIPLFGLTFTTTVGMIPFPVTFLLTDVLNEFYGKSAARFVTLVGFGMAVLAFVLIFVAGTVPIAPVTREPGWEGVTDGGFANVFLGSQRMIAASLSAFLISQFVDIAAFHFLRRVTDGRLLWLRATGSTVVSQLVDTCVINLVAWVGMMPIEKIFQIVFSAYGLKLIIAVGLTPVVYASHAAVERFVGMRPFHD
jgi:queuosine precursor transporter